MIWVWPELDDAAVLNRCHQPAQSLTDPAECDLLFCHWLSIQGTRIRGPLDLVGRDGTRRHELVTGLAGKPQRTTLGESSDGHLAL